MTTNINERIGWQLQIEKRTEAIVKAAEDTLSDERMTLLLMGSREWEKAGKGGRRDRKRPMRVAQFSNFLGIAKASNSSPSAIRNWVLYQMGRDETQANWQKTGLGNAIAGHLDEMYSWAMEIARNAFGQPTGEQVLQTHVSLIVQYAGYLRRWFIAKEAAMKSK